MSIMLEHYLKMVHCLTQVEIEVKNSISLLEKVN
ncbi:UNVERIFIED_CONTAM: hypothetical protein GTU68_041538 [Idotea baltica]|nr:hypothetical protein [Idotea baltica]